MQVRICTGHPQWGKVKEMDVQYIYAVCGNCEAAVSYYVERFDRPAEVKAEICGSKYDGNEYY